MEPLSWTPGMIMEDAWCAVCDEEMKVIIGMGMPGYFEGHTVSALMRQGETKVTFQCEACKRYYCWDCRYAPKSCEVCRAGAWRNRDRYYFPLNPQPPILIDETRESMSFPFMGETLYLPRQIIGLPHDVDVSKFNLYQKQRARASAKGIFRRLWALGGGILILCPDCGWQIQVIRESPVSTWKCLYCDFDHFSYWRVRNP